MMPKDPVPALLRYLVGAACVVVIVAGLKMAAPMVTLILMSLLLAFAISPVQKWLIRRKFRRGWAVLVTVLIVVVGGSGLFSLLAVSVAGFLDRLPVYEAGLARLGKSLNAFLAGLGIDPAGLLSAQRLEPKQVVAVAGDLLGAVLQGLSNGFFVMIIVVFVLVEMAGRQVRQVKGEKPAAGVQAVFDQAVESVGRYISITAGVGLINAAANYAFLLVLGIDYALTWAVLSFLFSFIPNIGIVMAVLAPATLALLEYGWLRALLVVAGFVAFNFLSDNVLKPRTMKSGLNISPLLTILSVIFWSWVLGAAGTILAVPLTITLQRMVKPQPELVPGGVRKQA